MIFLLDVNVLIAMIDPKHVDHQTAHRWFETHCSEGWATCPIIENGVIRILGNSAYPFEGGSGTPARIAALLRDLRSVPGHVFWPDDVSLLDSDLIDLDAILGSRQITDTYLLALAVTRGGMLATFDRRLNISAVTKGDAALHAIDRP